MPRCPIARLAFAAGFVAFSGNAASACGVPWFWLCEDYPPMVVPADNQRMAPTWTRNGFVYPSSGTSYPEPMTSAEPLLSLKDGDGRGPRWQPGYPAPRRW